MNGAPLTPPPAAAATKASWRRWARATRRALADGDPARRAERAVAAHLRAWERWRTARVALVYLAFGSELDPLAGGLLTPSAEPLAEGPLAPRLATTRTPEGSGALQVHVFDPTALEAHPLGFSQPRADAPLVDLAAIDVALVPGLCFDERGGRLGYGRGYYDRLLLLLSARVATVGITREALVLPRLPTEAHDVAVQWLLTEAGLRRTAG